jgi:glycerophosphoryl diester phosphodiesterase
MPERFNLQGHRGARGLQPENTLPSFEAALDVGVTSIETDLHLTRDGVPVLCHDPVIGLARGPKRRVRDLTLTELRQHRVEPEPQRFPDQCREATPLATWFAEQHEFEPYAPPTLADLLAFVRAYAEEAGAEAGKTPAQRARAARLIFDLELKRVPFHPETIGDGFDGSFPGLLERSVVEVLQAGGLIGRTVVRSFDHRCVRILRRLEPGLTGAVLIAGTAPVEPAELACRADAQIYCPEAAFLDEVQVRQCKAAGVRVLPWTVNQPEDWQRLLDWGLDGITTDYPDRLGEMLRIRGVAF